MYIIIIAISRSERTKKTQVSSLKKKKTHYLTGLADPAFYCSPNPYFLILQMYGKNDWMVMQEAVVTITSLISLLYWRCASGGERIHHQSRQSGGVLQQHLGDSV